MQRQQGMRTGTAKAKRAIFFYPIKKVYEELKKKKKMGCLLAQSVEHMTLISGS